MKKVFTLFAIIGMFLFVSCGNSTENKEKGEADATEAADKLLNEADKATETAKVSKDASAKDTTEVPVEVVAPTETDGEMHKSTEVK